MQLGDLSADLVTILILIVLEGLLSGDNALVLAVLVLPLPEEQQRKALRYGIIGAFVLRIIATILAAWLSKMSWVGLIGGLYLLYLPYKHFTSHPDEVHEQTPDQVRTWFGLSLFWTIVVKADLVDLVFAVDSILAAVAMTRKVWVIITGGLLGILMMRMLTMQVLELVKRYPRLIDGAYIVVCWVGIKLLWKFTYDYTLPDENLPTFAAWAGHFWEYLAQGKHTAHELHGVGRHLIPELPEWIAIGVVLVLFVGCFLWAKRESQSAALVAAADEAEVLLAPGSDTEATHSEVENPGAASDG